MLRKAARIYRKQGASQLAKSGTRFIYDTYLRTLLPKRLVRYNEIPVRAAHFGDSVVPWHTTDIPDYESALVRGIRQYIEEGDSVVIVGGGWGISTVVAARQAGDFGRIITFEGAGESVEKVEETVRLNDVEDKTYIYHSIIAQAISLRGESNAETIPPTELPKCDVLVLDCEGAEIDILNQMEIRPRVLIVETHGMYDATKEKVKDLLQSSGYELIECEVAEERKQGICRENGIYVISALSS